MSYKYKQLRFCSKALMFTGVIKCCILSQLMLLNMAKLHSPPQTSYHPQSFKEYNHTFFSKSTQDFSPKYHSLNIPKRKFLTQKAYLQDGKSHRLNIRRRAEEIHGKLDHFFIFSGI